MLQHYFQPIVCLVLFIRRMVCVHALVLDSDQKTTFHRPHVGSAKKLKLGHLRKRQTRQYHLGQTNLHWTFALLFVRFAAEADVTVQTEH